jgi:hypothetical protein
MQKRPSWEANNCSSSQELCILSNLKVHYSAQKVRHCTRSRARWIQPTFLNPTIRISIPNLSSHLRLGLRSCLFPSHSPKSKRMHLIPHILMSNRSTLPVSHKWQICRNKKHFFLSIVLRFRYIFCVFRVKVGHGVLLSHPRKFSDHYSPNSRRLFPPLQ